MSYRDDEELVSGFNMVDDEDEPLDTDMPPGEDFGDDDEDPENRYH